MPLGASRIALLARSSVTATATVVRRKIAIFKEGGVFQDYNRSKFGHSSINFDGSGDYVKTKYNTDNLGTGAFTWECFFNVDQDAGDGSVAILSNRHDSLSAGNIQMLFRNYDMKVQVNASGGTTAFNANGVGSALAVDTWHHFVFCRDDSSNVAVFVNGTRVANGSWDGTLNSDNDTVPFAIGALCNGSLPINSGSEGWIDEVRVSKVDRYGATNTSITVPTSAFTNDSDTELLLHGDGSIQYSTWLDDDNGDRDRVAIKAEGNAKSTEQQQAIAGCSVGFDGSGDFLRLKRSPAMSLGSSDFTIEFNLRLDSTGTQVVFADQDNSSQAYAIMVHSGSLKMWMSDNGSSWNIMSGNVIKSSISTSTWYHIAVVRNGSSIKAYVDGTETTGFATTTSSSLNDTGNDVTLGGLYEGSTAYLDGNMSDVRLSTTARYTGTFTPSTVKLENDSDTVFLIHPDSQNNSQQIRDDNGKGRSPITLDTVFGGTLSTTQTKFGFTSHRQTAEYQGLKIRDFNKYQRIADISSSSEFTIEGWFMRESDGDNTKEYLIEIASGSNTCGIYYDRSASRLKYETEGISRITSSGSLSNSTWYHIAVVRDTSNNTKMYIDGTQTGSTFTNDDRAWNSSTQCLLGVSRSGDKSAKASFDEWRISKNQRYTADFTAPTDTFTNDADTICLFHFEGVENGSQDRYFDDNGTYSD